MHGVFAIKYFMISMMSSTLEISAFIFKSDTASLTFLSSILQFGQPVPRIFIYIMKINLCDNRKAATIL